MKSNKWFITFTLCLSALSLYGLTRLLPHLPTRFDKRANDFNDVAFKIERQLVERLERENEMIGLVTSMHNGSVLLDTSSTHNENLHLLNSMVAFAVDFIVASANGGYGRVIPVSTILSNANNGLQLVSQQQQESVDVVDFLLENACRGDAVCTLQNGIVLPADKVYYLLALDAILGVRASAVRARIALKSNKRVTAPAADFANCCCRDSGLLGNIPAFNRDIICQFPPTVVNRFLPFHSKGGGGSKLGRSVEKLLIRESNNNTVNWPEPVQALLTRYELEMQRFYIGMDERLVNMFDILANSCPKREFMLDSSEEELGNHF